MRRPDDCVTELWKGWKLGVPATFDGGGEGEGRFKTELMGNL